LLSSGNAFSCTPHATAESPGLAKGARADPRAGRSPVRNSFRAFARFFPLIT